MPKRTVEDMKKAVSGTQERLKKAVDAAPGKRYDPLVRTFRKKLKRAQRKLATLSGQKLARKHKKAE
jgi:hypothetical protein